MSDEDREIFPFEFESPDWMDREYLSEIHIAGSLKHALRVS